MGSDIEVRRADASEVAEIVAVAGAALGWDPADPNEAFFRWKHLENPAGASPMWLALDGDAIAGFRTMLRWTYRRGDHTVDAVRAVDTATHPDHQRKGVFRRLTGTAVEELTAGGIDFVFNTPNARSRPGYLTMGWIEAGRIPARFSPAGPGALPRLARSRTAAAKWSEPLADGDQIDTVADDLAASAPAPDALVTDRTADHLRWRYSFEPLHYRAIQTDDAVAVVRVRRRGAAHEAVIAEVMSPSARATRRLFGHIRRLPGVDHLLTVAAPPHPAPWFPSIPGLGPILTVRSLASPAPSLDQLRLSLGDVELF